MLNEDLASASWAAALVVCLNRLQGQVLIQAGGGRDEPIPQLVSEIQAATTNAGARPQGALPPTFWRPPYRILGYAKIIKKHNTNHIGNLRPSNNEHAGESGHWLELGRMQTILG